MDNHRFMHVQIVEIEGEIFRITTTTDIAKIPRAEAAQLSADDLAPRCT